MPRLLFHSKNEYSRMKSLLELHGCRTGNQEGPGCYDLGRVLVLFKNARFVRVNGKDQT